jgi:gliding motility-associated-like protein
MRAALLLIFLSTFLHAELAFAHSGEQGSLVFIENKNQWDARVKFKAEIPGGNLYLEGNCFTYNFLSQDGYFAARGGHGRTKTAGVDVIKAHSLKATFLGANTSPVFSKLNPQEAPYHYFIGNDPSKWASDVQGFEKIRYHNLYPGIDLLAYAQNRNFKYDFIVKPGANINQINVKYEGAEKLSIKNGSLIIKTSFDELVEQKPYSYQIKNGKEIEVSCKFILKGDVLTYAFPDGFDKDLELIIDPVLIFSTYSGSTADNFGFTATFDGRGYLYAASTAFGFGYNATPGAYQINFAGGAANAGTDIAITKYDTTGTFRIYSTYLGGAGDELPHSLVVNNNNELFIYGTTGSGNFPTTLNGFSRLFKGGPNLPLAGLGVNFPQGTDIFVSRLSNTGSQLLASTFLGGTNNDGINSTPGNQLKYNYADEVRGEIDIDNQNNIYIVSCTRSSDFPIMGSGFQPVFGGGNIDGIIVKMDNSLSNIIWSTYLGGSNHDAAYSLAIDAVGDLYVAGGTNSNDFPTAGMPFKNAFQGGRSDGFISHISSNGSLLLNSSFIGSAQYDQVYFVEVDKVGSVYLFGQTENTGSVFIFNVAYSVVGGGQFVCKLSPNLSNLIFSTAFGTGLGKPNISPTAFLVDLCEKIYLAGWGGAVNASSAPNSATTTGMFVTSNALQSTTDGSDFYLMVLEDDASSVFYATFFGGNGTMEHVDGGTSRFDRKGRIYQTACACGGTGTNFPVHPNPGAYSITNNSVNCNSAVFKIDLELPFILADFDTPLPGCAPVSVNFVNRSKQLPGTTYSWDFGDGNVSNLANPNHIYTAAGVYTITLIATNNNSCNLADTMKKQVVMLSNTSFNLPAKILCNQGTVQIGVSPITGSSLTYQWTPSTGLSATNVSNPFATVNNSTQFQLIISNGVCADTIRQWVTIVPKNISTSPDTFMCSPAQITLKAFGNGLYQSYQWSTNINFTNTLNSSPTDSFAVVNITGSQVFYIRAIVNGCVSIDSVKVQLYQESVYSLPTVSICEGSSATIGIPTQTGLSYTWNPPTGLTNPNISNPMSFANASINYTLTVFNGFCTDTVFQSVQVTPLAVLSVNNDTTICKGNIVNLVASTGGLYQNYIWSSTNIFSDTLNSVTTNNQLIVSPNANQWFFIKTTQGPCSVTDSVKITILRDTTFALPIIQICRFDSVVLGAGITVDPNLNYFWQPPTGLSNTNITNPLAAPVTGLTYLLIMDNGVCRDSIFQPIGVTALDLATSNDTLICEKNPVVVAASSFGTSINYAWSLQKSFTNLLNPNPIDSVILYTPNQGHNWLFVRIEEAGCFKYDSVNVQLREVALRPETYNLCWSDSAAIQAISLHPEPLTYNWSSSNGLTIPSNGPLINVAPTQPLTQYFVNAENAFGCKGSATYTVNVSQLKASDVVASIARDTILLGESTELSALPYSGFPIQWLPIDGLSNANAASTMASPSKSTVYFLKVGDGLCSYVDSVSLTVYEIKCMDPYVFLPNAFTPNGDGNNDVLRVRGLFIDEIKLMVFNRWGEKVFETDDQRIGWDGTFRGMEADPGVFVYHLYAKCVDGQTFTKKGNITLIR